MAKFVGNYDEFIQTQIQRLQGLCKSDPVNAKEYKEQIKQLQREGRHPKTKDEAVKKLGVDPDANINVEGIGEDVEETKKKLKEEVKGLKKKAKDEISKFLNKKSFPAIIAFAESLNIFTKTEIIKNSKIKKEFVDFLSDNILIDTITGYAWDD